MRPVGKAQTHYGFLPFEFGLRPNGVAHASLYLRPSYHTPSIKLSSVRAMDGAAQAHAHVLHFLIAPYKTPFSPAVHLSTFSFQHREKHIIPIMVNNTRAIPSLTLITT